jgi:apolipoprotein N-acyltransferase
LEKGRKIEVVVTQPNIDPNNEKFDISNPDAQLHKMVFLANQKITKNTAIVLAPETAIPFPFNETIFSEIPPYAVLTEAMKSWENTDLLIGASTLKFFKTKNSRAAKLSPYDNGGFIEYYNTSVFMELDKEPKFLHKSKLVLAAEIVPFANWFPVLENLSLNLGGTGTGTLGIEKVPSNFKAKNFTFAPVICYESVYGDFVAEQCKKGAEAIFIITNDGWWGDTPGYKQHASFAQLRAIENRRYVARSANTGKTCIINQRGDMIQETEWWKATAIRSDIYLNDKITFYSAQGDGIGRVFAFVSGLFILLAIVRKIKPQSTKNK